jgi:Aspartyl/Asparaginyl beta-hydroxylase
MSRKRTSLNKFTHLYPWQVASRLAGAQLTCRVLDELGIDMDTVRSEVDRIVSEYSPAVHSGRYHDGGWKAIGLIAHNGDPADDRLKLPLKKTRAFALAPYLESLFDGLAAKKLRVRLMELQPGKSILWHYDRGESIDGNRSVRFHMPIVTNEGVRCQISHEDVLWREGEIWYGDFSFPHRLFNGGENSRIHLVFDLTWDDFVLSLFPREFLQAKSRRMRIKGACQHMVDLYDISRLPSAQKFERIKRLIRNAVLTTPKAAT